MKIVQIQFAPWDKIYNFDPADSVLSAGDYVIVKTELGIEIGKVAGFKELKTEEEPAGAKELKPILRKATLTDLEKVSDKKQKKEALEYCKNLAVQYKLPMKLVDAHFSFDGSRVTFAFVADGRIDFRELVKDLTRHLNRTIRLQQIGIRDEAKMVGDYGHCGFPLCCKRFLSEFVSVTSEKAELQQVAHRGSYRISGICGRLMCCLNYEEEGYEECAKKLPPMGAKVDVDGKKGVVVRHHTLKQAVSVEFKGEKNGDGKTIVEVDLNRNKK
ncbi:stage 0 sporulation protein [Patescibacteria group bacterium]|nr:stage 0 sporulation protein [Patescibacteria group bacterium]MCG2698653.1 stage 0 sporulation protein [Candidatus Parcubacteria bacterium]MBU4015070.1 stage 0 sporulation protein [Patescibacteria group bacterium]MBU4026186.1 stage 0 sporulation protein [Patescibacteria group bacterium]MBU4073690.1 stage 0 sporulation protein [Patescibacteria group bacterium]